LADAATRRIIRGMDLGELMGANDDAIETEILRLCRARGAGKTICPSEAARALAPDQTKWQALLPATRRVAADLARRGALATHRKGKLIEPPAMKGALRLGRPPAAPRSGAPLRSRAQLALRRTSRA